MRNTKSLLIFFIAVLCNSCAHHLRKDLIPWSKNLKITWGDFKGDEPVNINGHDARTYVAWDNPYTVYTDSVRVEITTYFVPYTSWARSEYLSQDLLVHEKGHFNIGEIMARQFREYLIDRPWRENEDFELIFADGIQSFLKNDSLNKLYDFETDHSKNIENQQRWNVKIDSMLSDWKDYANPKFTVYHSFLH